MRCYYVTLQSSFSSSLHESSLNILCTVGDSWCSIDRVGVFVISDQILIRRVFVSIEVCAQTTRKAGNLSNTHGRYRMKMPRMTMHAMRPTTALVAGTRYQAESHSMYVAFSGTQYKRFVVLGTLSRSHSLHVLFITISVEGGHTWVRWARVGIGGLTIYVSHVNGSL